MVKALNGPKTVRQRPLTSKRDRDKYWVPKVDVLDEQWYDERDPAWTPAWPKYYEHAKIQEVGGEPVRDPRAERVQRWRRPVSEEKERPPWEERQIELQRGHSIKQLVGKDTVRALKKVSKDLKRDRDTYHPD